MLGSVKSHTLSSTGTCSVWPPTATVNCPFASPAAAPCGTYASHSTDAFVWPAASGSSLAGIASAALSGTAMSGIIPAFVCT